MAASSLRLQIRIDFRPDAHRGIGAKPNAPPTARLRIEIVACR